MIFLILIGLVLVGISGFSSYAIFTSEVTSSNEIVATVTRKTAVQTIKGKVGQDGLRKIEQEETTQMTATTEYRYSGDNDSVNNYITFNNETWRIIGVFEVEDENGKKEERLKIIREKPLDVVKAYGYTYGRWTYYSTNSYSYYYLNNDYYNSIGANYKKLIAPTKYYLGGTTAYSTITPKTAYTAERGSAYSTYSANIVTNIGLMYASDYGYAADSSCDSTAIYSFSNSCYSKDWLYGSSYTKGSNYIYTGTSTSAYEWFLTAYTSSSYAHALTVNSGALTRTSYSSSYLMRPTLYLKSSAIIDSGNGTKGKPYRLDLGHPSETSILQSTTSGNTEELWGHKSDITKIIFQDELEPIDGAKETWDLSDSSVPANSVMGYLVTDPEDSTKNIAYIQGKGGVYANLDSSNLFYGFKSLKTIDGMEYLNTSKVTNMSNMFGASMFSASALTSLDLSSFDTSNVTNMSKMFYYAKKLTSLDLSSFDTSQVTDMSEMFSDATSLISLDVSSFDTSKVTNMSSMFKGTTSLTSLDVSSFDTSNVTNMQKMFYSLYKVTSLDLSNFNTSKVTDMSEMFANSYSNASKLASIDLSSFDTSKVTNMSYMFDGACSLVSLDVSSFDTSNVTNMRGMFIRTTLLTDLDFRKAIFDKVTSYSSMFSQVPSNIKITTKNATTKSWLQSRLSEDSITGATFVIVE